MSRAKDRNAKLSQPPSKRQRRVVSVVNVSDGEDLEQVKVNTGLLLTKDGEHATSLDGELATSLDGEHAVSLDGEHAVSLDGEHAVSLDGEHAVSLDGEHAVSLDDEYTTSLDGELTTSLDGELTTSLDGEHTTSLDGEHATSLDGELTTSLDGELTTSLDGEHTTSLDGEHTTSLDGEYTTSLDGEYTTSLDGEHTASLDGEHTTALDGEHATSLDGERATSVLSDSSVEDDAEDTFNDNLFEDEHYISTQTEAYPDGRHVQTREEQRLHLQISVLESENQRLRSEKHNSEQSLLSQLAQSHASNMALHNSLSETTSKLSARDIKNEDSKTCFYTGLSKYAVFNALFDLLKTYYVNSSLPDSVKMDYFFAFL